MTDHFLAFWCSGETFAAYYLVPNLVRTAAENERTPSCQMATPKSVSAADLVPHSKLKVTVLPPHESDGTGLLGQVGLRLDKIPAAPTAVGVAVGVAPRHVIPLWRHPLCRLIIWGLCCFLFGSILFSTIVVSEIAHTLPLRLLCRLATCCLCCAAAYCITTKILYRDHVCHRLLCRILIFELGCLCFISASNFYFELPVPGAPHIIPLASVQLYIIPRGLLLSVCFGLNINLCCLLDTKARPMAKLVLPACLENETESTADETKAPV